MREIISVKLLNLNDYEELGDNPISVKLGAEPKPNGRALEKNTLPLDF